MRRDEIKQLITKAVDQANLETAVDLDQVSLETAPFGSHGRGDYATAVALTLAKKINLRPIDLARLLAANIRYQLSPSGQLEHSTLSRVEAVEPGFINFYLSDSFLQSQVAEILKQRENYGRLDLGQKQKLEVEFISANPTGPLTCGNARGGFWGDVLANVLAAAGFQVFKDYYINDYGMQVLALGHSVLKDDQAQYKASYVDWLAEKILQPLNWWQRLFSFWRQKPTKDPYRVGELAAKLVINEMIKKTVERMGVRFDDWISETWLHRTGRVQKALNILKKQDFLYEKEGAWFFKSSHFGDQRDRVIVKGNEWKTYLAGDAGLHYYKFAEKKFHKVINIWGADHYGDVPGLQAVVTALGFADRLDVVLLQFVTLFQNGQELKMSKRTGTFVTVDELLDLVGKDAARFFFLQKSPDTHLDFDVDLAKEQSEKNPVFYVQYAHARICSILSKFGKSQIPIAKLQAKSNLKLLRHPSELTLIKQLRRLPETIEDISRDYQVQRLGQFALDLATAFHQFYRDCRVLSPDVETSRARLALVLAAKITLKNTLDLLGISAPEKM